MAFTSSDLRFTVVVDKPTQKITFTEATDYAYWSGGDSYASGLLKITDSIGSVLYENTGYASGDYTAPDIIAQADLKLTVEDIIMNTSNGAIITGDYTVDYKVVTYSGLGSVLNKAIVATAATKTIVMSGMIQAEADSVVVFGWLGITSGLNIGSYSIASSVFSSGAGTLTIVVNETIVDETSTEDAIQFNYPSALLFQTSKIFTYCYSSPEVSIGYTILCSNSQLTSSDNTGYTVLNGGITLPTYALTRVHSVIAPVGSGFGWIADSSSQIRTFTDIWTKIWQTSIASTLIYDVDTFAANEAQIAMVWYQISDSVSGSDSAIVACQACSCDIRLCIYNLTVAWIVALGKSHTTAERLGNDVLKVTAFYTQYLQAERCGADTSVYCELIGEILDKYGCPCTIAEDAPSQLVIATNLVAGEVQASDVRWETGAGTNSVKRKDMPGVASGDESYSEGYETEATGVRSHAEGEYSIASGADSHAEGVDTRASDYAAHAEGEASIASGVRSHAQNAACIASGDNSHAGGYQSQAISTSTFNHSHADSVGDSYVLGATSAILGGANNKIEVNAQRSAIIGGLGITETEPNTVVVPKLRTDEVGEGVQMKSPNGTEYKVTVSDLGTIVVTAV